MLILVDPEERLELVDVVRDPTLLYAPWLAHSYPGLTPLLMYELRWSTFVGLWDALRNR